MANSTVSAQKFENRSQEAGLNMPLIAGTGTNGLAISDYNNDGILDVYFVVPAAFNPANKGTWNLLFRGNGDDTFSEITKDVGVYGKGENISASYMGKKMGASWGDFNNDGYPDLFLSNTGFDQLLQNNRDGTFTDITDLAGVAGGPSQFSATGLWWDYDNDGDLDLYVSIWEDYSDGDRVMKNRMYENLGDGGFKDVSEASGLDDSGKTWMAVALDFNKDGRLDLYLANDFGENKLYINQGDKKFTEESESYAVNDRYEGMGIAVGDPNNDAFFDLYITNATEKPFNDEQINPLFINNGVGSFTNKSTEAGVELAGWGWGTEFFDYNNDGWEDLYVVNGYFESSIDSNRFFKNISTPDSIAFEEISASIGINDVAESRTFLSFDYNNDGSLDILISNFTAKPVLYKNNTQGDNWLKVELEGTDTNRNGFGSTIVAEANDKVYTKFYHGAHFYGQSILPVHFGLADAQTIDKLTVYWLSGHIDVMEQIQVNQTIRVKEFEGLSTTSIQSEALVKPNKIQLIGNYPNPFNSKTNIIFKLSEPSLIQFRIYNSIGQLIHFTDSKTYSSGTHSYSWSSNEFNSGVYFYQIIDSKGISITSKMLYLK
ncbi:MAG: FG-GAP-like repeat-containing protein [Balneolaceae bacterium]